MADVPQARHHAREDIRDQRQLWTPTVKAGQLGATSQQYPLKMAQEGVKSIATYAKDGTKPTNPGGTDFTNTGVNLITDQPASGVESKDTTFGAQNCWG